MSVIITASIILEEKVGYYFTLKIDKTCHKTCYKAPNLQAGFDRD